MANHELTYTGATHVGVAQHQITGKCSCGNTFSSVSRDVKQARGNVREQYYRHVRRFAEFDPANTLDLRSRGG